MVRLHNFFSESTFRSGDAQADNVLNRVYVPSGPERGVYGKACMMLLTCSTEDWGERSSTPHARVLEHFEGIEEVHAFRGRTVWHFWISLTACTGLGGFDMQRLYKRSLLRREDVVVN